MQVMKMTRITHAHNDDGDIESEDDDSDNKDTHAYTGYTMMVKKMGDKCARMIGYFSSFFLSQLIVLEPILELGVNLFRRRFIFRTILKGPFK